MRQGRWELPAVLEWAQRLENELGELAETSPLPEHPDLGWVNGSLHRAYTQHWAVE